MKPRGVSLMRKKVTKLKKTTVNKYFSQTFSLKWCIESDKSIPSLGFIFIFLIFSDIVSTHRSINPHKQYLDSTMHTSSTLELFKKIAISSMLLIFPVRDSVQIFVQMLKDSSKAILRYNLLIFHPYYVTYYNLQLLPDV